MEQSFERTEMLIGKEGLRKLAAARSRSLASAASADMWWRRWREAAWVRLFSLTMIR